MTESNFPSLFLCGTFFVVCDRHILTGQLRKTPAHLPISKLSISRLQKTLSPKYLFVTLRNTGWALSLVLQDGEHVGPTWRCVTH